MSISRQGVLTPEVCAAPELQGPKPRNVGFENVAAKSRDPQNGPHKILPQCRLVRRIRREDHRKFRSAVMLLNLRVLRLQPCGDDAVKIRKMSYEEMIPARNDCHRGSLLHVRRQLLD